MQHPLRHRPKKAPTEQPHAFVLFLLLSFSFSVNARRPFASPPVCTSAISLGNGGTPVVY
jgi:hypothetical protein